MEEVQTSEGVNVVEAEERSLAICIGDLTVFLVCNWEFRRFGA